jgi:hypothetical protein
LAAAAGATPPFDGVPDEVVTRAKAAFGTGATDPLAELILDSAFDTDDPDALRRLRFASATLSVEAVVTRRFVGRAIRGHVEPEHLHVRLELDGDQAPLPEEEAGGGFTFEYVPSGLMRLRFDEPDGSESSFTDWFIA